MLNNSLSVNTLLSQTENNYNFKKRSPSYILSNSVSQDTVSFGSSKSKKSIPLITLLLGALAGNLISNNPLMLNKRPPDDMMYPEDRPGEVYPQEQINRNPFLQKQENDQQKEHHQQKPQQRAVEKLDQPDFPEIKEQINQDPPPITSPRKPERPKMPPPERPSMTEPSPPVMPPPMNPGQGDKRFQNLLSKYDVSGQIKELIMESKPWLAEGLNMQGELQPNSIINYFDPDTNKDLNKIQLSYDNGLSLIVPESNQEKIKVTTFLTPNGPFVYVSSPEAFIANVDGVNPQTGFIFEVTKPTREPTLITAPDNHINSLVDVTLLGYNIKIDNNLKVDKLTAIGTAHNANKVKTAFIDGAGHVIHGRDRDGVTFFVRLDDNKTKGTHIQSNFIAPYAYSENRDNIPVYRENDGDIIFILDDSKGVSLPANTSIELWDITQGGANPLSRNSFSYNENIFRGTDFKTIMQWWLESSEPESSDFKNWLDDNGLSYFETAIK